RSPNCSLIELQMCSNSEFGSIFASFKSEERRKTIQYTCRQLMMQLQSVADKPVRLLWKVKTGCTKRKKKESSRK
ncbi:MAG: hypothetical protein ACI8RD_000981, partial [Bacillariaceae sp.]